MNMTELKNNSIHIIPGMAVCWPQYGDKETTLDVSDNCWKFNDSYATNNSVVCFVVNHEMYVTPYTQEIIDTLDEAGLWQRSFYVPFSNWDYPKYESRRWERLWEKARAAD